MSGGGEGGGGGMMGMPAGGEGGAGGFNFGGIMKMFQELGKPGGIDTVASMAAQKGAPPPIPPPTQISSQPPMPQVQDLGGAIGGVPNQPPLGRAGEIPPGVFNYPGVLDPSIGQMPGGIPIVQPNAISDPLAAAELGGPSAGGESVQATDVRKPVGLNPQQAEMLRNITQRTPLPPPHGGGIPGSRGSVNAAGPLSIGGGQQRRLTLAQILNGGS